MKENKKKEGIISINSKGTGYVNISGEKKAKNKDEDIEIDFKDLNTALHGDTVEIVLNAKKVGGRISGIVVNILSRAKIGFAGILEKEDTMFFFKPDDTKMYTDILIPVENLNGAKEGDKVYVEITDW